MDHIATRGQNLQHERQQRELPHLTAPNLTALCDDEPRGTVRNCAMFFNERPGCEWNEVYPYWPVREVTQ
jgi:hypothetical protein